MNNNQITTTLNRLKEIVWEYDDNRLPSYYYLILEYLRRSALWAQALGIKPHWPFFDISEFLGNVPEIPEVDTLSEHLDKYTVESLVRKTCKWALLWSAIENTEECKKYSLPAPYEPLIRMYERGGTFWPEHGYINIFVMGIPIASIENYIAFEPLLSLDDEYLDTLQLPSEE